MEIETMITKEEVIEWCEENDFKLVKKLKEPVEIESVLRIAEKSTGIKKGEITVKRRYKEFSFARFLAACYLYNYYESKVIAKLLNFHPTEVSHAVKQKLFDSSRFKYFAMWQKIAVSKFINEISLSGGEIVNTELRERGPVNNK